ncbi:unnamed protein product [Brassicogethes aeneus]|uniref:EGF-like domain-containing protein n=1 Tax=Brassicogethes aeneus TaxID=1431903 RepID=A0A9P0AXE0_BRAAE|nr:unnamed protein product [Brassicogethes aeneus]
MQGRDVMETMLKITRNDLLLWIFIFITPLLAERICNTTDAVTHDCSESEYCNENKKCTCLPGYTRLNDTFCIQRNNSAPNYSSLVYNNGNGSLVAGIVIPLCLILIVISGVYISRRYDVLDWIRQKINQRNSNYDEFMIGQDLDDDDPPIR